MADRGKTAATIGGRQLVYGIVLTVAGIAIFTGLKGVFDWPVPEVMMTAAGAAFGVAVSFGLIYLRKL